VRVKKAVRDTPSSVGACVFTVWSNYVERIKRYGPDKQKVNGWTDTRTHGQSTPYHYNTSRRAYKKYTINRDLQMSP
jgi:hypothetical protein